jgi:hypothetical protein
MLSITSGEGQDILSVVCAHIANQQNQAPPAPVDKHKEFMSHYPPTYSHSTDPLDPYD